MQSPVIVRASLLALAALGATSELLAQSARETVYFTTPNNKISRANFTNGTSQLAVTDNGTNLNGLVVRYDGNDAATLLVANGTLNGDVRAYRCATATAPCQKLGIVFPLKKAVAVALDTFGNLYAVNAHNGGADQLLFAARKPSCPTDQGTSLPDGCFPGGYGPVQVIDSQVDGVNELADVKVEASTGDVIVLASSPAKLLRYAAADVKARVTGGLTEPTPAALSASFAGQSPSGLALFPTGEMFVVTCQGSVLVFNGGVSNVFTTLGASGTQIAIGVEGGAQADPVASGRVLVTGGGQVLSFGITRDSGGKLVASPSMPDGTVCANGPFGVADASLVGSIYTPASAGPLVVQLPIGHQVTFEKINSGGLTQGNYYVVLESTVRSAPAVGSCGPGEALTLEGLTRCVPSYVRGYPLSGSTCLNDGSGSGCYYLVFVADTGANVFGSTQQHHFEEDDFGFSTTCYAGTHNSPAPMQPRTFHGTDANDPPVVEAEEVFDISSGCGSHIGRGGQFSVFVTGWDSRSVQAVTTDKLNNLSSALLGTNAFAGGLAPYIDPYLLGTAGKKNTLAKDLYLARQAWNCGNKTLTVSYLNTFIARVKANLAKFSECPVGIPCRNTPGELVSRAESAAFLACGAKQSCQRVLP